MDGIVVFDDVSKTFRIRKQTGLRGMFRAEYTEVQALKNIDFTLQEGGIYGLIGENGAGKSTTIKLLTGILHPDQGQIRVFDQDPFRTRQELMRSVGIMFGQRSLLKPVIPVKFSLDWLKGLYGIPDAEYEQRLELLSQRFGIGDLLDRPPRQLSLGQRRRCDLLAILMHQPRLLLLDEPEIALDFRAKARFRQLLVEYAEEYQLTILISSHDLGSLEQYCTDYIIMNRGEVIFTGKPDQMREQFSPKNIIKLKIAQVRDEAKRGILSADEHIRIDQNNDTVMLYVDQSIDLEAIISQCYTAYEVISIDISSNSLEQVLLRTEGAI